jgi:molybdopterin-containing oxidoreductase family membrane subunit
LIVPAFIPSTLHEIVEYFPSLVEWQITAGIWAWGLLILTVALKMALPILREPHSERENASPAVAAAPTSPAKIAP